MTTKQDVAQGLQITREVSKYMKLKFMTTVMLPGSTISHPGHWPLKLRLDCDIAVMVMVEAYENSGKIRLYCFCLRSNYNHITHK